MSHYGARGCVLFFGPEHGVVAHFRWDVKSGGDAAEQQDAAAVRILLGEDVC
jgi:hypothetical protein